MAKTLTNLQTGVRVYLDEAQQTDFLDTEVIRSINYAYHKVVQRVMEVYEWFYETTTPFTYAMVKGQQEYTIDATLIKVSRVEVNWNPAVSGSAPSRVIPVKMDEVMTQLNNTASSGGSFFQAGYYLHGNIGSQAIGFMPIPTVSDTGGAKSISVWGVSLPTDLVSGTDNVNIPWADNFSQIVEKWAAGVLLRKGQQAEAESARYIAESQADMQDMMIFLKERQSDGLNMIQDSELENLDFEASFPF